MLKSELLPSLFAWSLFGREQITLLIFALSHTKMSNSHEKPKSDFPTLLYTFPLLLLFLILTIPYLFHVLDVQYLVYPSLHFLHVVVIFLSILFHNFFMFLIYFVHPSLHFLHVIVIFLSIFSITFSCS